MRERTLEFRSKVEQLPNANNQIMLISAIIVRFEDEPRRSERGAARIVERMLGKGTKLEVTRAVMGGGRDAIGTFRIGGLENGSKLISHLRPNAGRRQVRSVCKRSRGSYHCSDIDCSVIW
jgi:hypothetical protein